ncbi:TetR/AcrR family transcriptional regulator [Amycolatopsis sp. NPDC051903]|uniref:TetR/AcrR family transcriptional regulator n=1 Tax=Amycolatopsis sp. NPDC051903 TaxID=3363936 RepID=UPI0037AAF381
MPDRTDAQHNHARILETAAAALAEDGDVSLNSIAKRAGVGPGTLYRHFPTREALVLAVYRTEVGKVVDWAPELLAEEPPPVALRRWFLRLAHYVVLKRGLGDALTKAGHAAAIEQTRDPVLGAISLILRAGEADGTLRRGLDPDDVLLMMSCLWRVPPGSGGEQQAERLLDILVPGFAPPAP